MQASQLGPCGDASGETGRRGNLGESGPIVHVSGAADERGDAADVDATGGQSAKSCRIGGRRKADKSSALVDACSASSGVHAEGRPEGCTPECSTCGGLSESRSRSSASSSAIVTGTDADERMALSSGITP